MQPSRVFRGAVIAGWLVWTWAAGGREGGREGAMKHWRRKMFRLRGRHFLNVIFPLLLVDTNEEHLQYHNTPMKFIM